jgi:hypothetical protein
MALGNASARLEYVRLAPRWICRFLLSHTIKNGFHRTPPLSMPTVVPQSALGVIMTYHAIVRCMIRPNRLSAPFARPSEAAEPTEARAVLFVRILG